MAWGATISGRKWYILDDEVPSTPSRPELLATLVRARSTLGVREATLAFAAASGRSAAGAVITCAAAGNASRSNPSPGAPAPAAPTAYLCPQRRSSRAAAAPQLGRVGHGAAGRPTRCGTTSEMAHEAKRGAAPILATSSVSCAPASGLRATATRTPPPRRNSENLCLPERLPLPASYLREPFPSRGGALSEG